MNLVPPAIVLALAACVQAQDAAALQPVTQAYRSAPIAERVTIEAIRGASPPARSEMTIAMRPGAQPALAIALGADDPLRILAEPGRLLAWRESDRSRVFVAPLGEPFGRASIERVLPPLMAPQIDLAFAEEPGPLLTVMPDLTWSRVASGERDRYAGVAASAALSLTVDADGRLTAYEAQRDGHILVRATVTRAEPDPSWFEAPSLDGPTVSSLADLARASGPVRVGDVYGQALGIDARGRPTTLRDIAKGEGNVVVLALDARQREARAELVGALAEAELARLVELLDVRIVILAIGEPDTAALFERVIEQPRRARSGGHAAIRAIAIDAAPPWLELADPGAAYAVHGRSWVLTSVAPVPLSQQGAPPEHEDPWQASTAPRGLPERLAEAVGAVARDF